MKRKKNIKKKSSSFSKLSLFQKAGTKFFKPCPFSGKDAPVIDYKNITMPELITTRRIIAKEIILVEEQMEEIERDYCF